MATRPRVIEVNTDGFEEALQEMVETIHYADEDDVEKSAVQAVVDKYHEPRS